MPLAAASQLQAPVKPQAVQNSQPSRRIMAAAPQLGHTFPLMAAVPSSTVLRV